MRKLAHILLQFLGSLLVFVLLYLVLGPTFSGVLLRMWYAVVSWLTSSISHLVYFFLAMVILVAIAAFISMPSGEQTDEDP